ncbi:MAG: DsbA family protein [Hyphomonadaceae bacterium]|nr:DsbA family protein [Hyphomonadaceae bacterium]
MMQKLSGLALALSSLLLLPACAEETASASTQSMTRAEVEEIVRDYLLENPEVIEDALLILDARQKAEEERAAREALTANHDALYQNAADYSIGPDDAEVTVVEFFDYRCGYCKRSVDYVAGLPANYEGNVRVVFKELPILSSESRIAARAALAAGLQGKYFEMHVGLMESRGNFTNAEINMIAQEAGIDVEQMREDMETDAVNDQLADSLALARALGVTGTPAFFVGDTRVPGANTPAVTRLIEDQLG